MSRATQIEFESLVAPYHQRHKDALHLSNPSFKEDEFITTATMIGLGGHVETRCGPAEYHAEIFIFTLDDQKRWDLAELMA